MKRNYIIVSVLSIAFTCFLFSCSIKRSYLSNEQLERIADVTKDIAKVETNVAAYNDANLGKDYRYWARETFDKDIDNINFFLFQNNKIINVKNIEKIIVNVMPLQHTLSLLL